MLTTDEKPTVVYPIPDEIPTTLAFSSVNWCEIDVFTLNIMVLHHKMSQSTTTKIQNDLKNLLYVTLFNSMNENKAEIQEKLIKIDQF